MIVASVPGRAYGFSTQINNGARRGALRIRWQEKSLGVCAHRLVERRRNKGEAAIGPNPAPGADVGDQRTVGHILEQPLGRRIPEPIALARNLVHAGYILNQYV